MAWGTWGFQIFAMLCAFYTFARHFNGFVLPWSDLATLTVYLIITAYVAMKDGQYKVDFSLAARRTFQQYSEVRISCLAFH